MEYAEILKNFFENYGVSIVDINTNKKIKGIIAPIRELSVKQEEICFTQLGFYPKAEWILICEIDNEIIKTENTVLIDNKLMKIMCCDDYLLADKPFYKRAYLYKIKEN